MSSISERWSAVLVAGGHGRRAGGPKALALRDGQLMWRWQVNALRAAGCGAIAAVLHPTAMPTPDLARQLQNADVQCVCADADAEMLASLQLGLRALGDRAAGHLDQPVFMLPVDCPCPESAVFAELQRVAAAMTRNDQPWEVVRPWVETDAGRKRGHPVVLGPALVAAVDRADATTGRLDWLIRDLPESHRVDVQVEDTGICGNFNWGGLGGSGESNLELHSK